MNDKIEELYNKSLEKYTYSDCDGDNNHGIRLNEEKFAELIVRECFKIVDDYGIEQAGIAEENYRGEQLYVSMKITDSAYKIKEHFGIE